MKFENEMRSRKEKQVRSEKEGAAIRQDYRSTASGRNRYPRPSVAELRDEDEFTSKLYCVGMALVGAIIMFGIMWLACAY